MDDDDSDPVVLRDGVRWAEAVVVRGLLESAGIPCELARTNGGAINDVRSPPQWVRVVVRRGDLADATAALGE